MRPGARRSVPGDVLSGVRVQRGGVLWIGVEPRLDPAPGRMLSGDELLDGALDAESHDAVVLAEDQTRGRENAVVRAVQRVLRPGGRVVLVSRRRNRLLRRLLQSHFDGDEAPGARHPLVRGEKNASGDWVYVAHRRNGHASATHFEELAPRYRDEIPDHMADHYRQRKLVRILEHVSKGDVVLDLGCGLGDYAREVRRVTGARVIAMDASGASLKVAREGGSARGVEFVAASTLRLPLPDDCLDVVYTVNMLHHLKRGEQEFALEEIKRTLRPDGLLIVYEMNLRNPLFALYMRHVFPRTRGIDRGDEEFLPDRAWPLVEGFEVAGLEHHTFIPDFLPRVFVRPLQRLEGVLERSPIRRQAVHYTVALRKRRGEGS